MQDHINGNFDSTLSQMYDSVTEESYYSMFFRSIFCNFSPQDLEGKAVLDIGCGNGKLCQLFQEKGARYTMGVDISPAQIQLARNLYDTPAYQFQVQDAYRPFFIGKSFDVVSCIYALHFVPDYETLRIACQNIADHVAFGGIAIVLDITHDYVYRKAQMNRLRQLSMYEYIPDVEEGQIPPAWSHVKGRVHTPTEVLHIDHIAIHGTNLKRALTEVGFSSVERKNFIHPNESYVKLWGPNGFNHHLFVCKKE
ncbi:MAG: class I SAM-dependent methyltransferase [Bacteroidota bacterium]